MQNKSLINKQIISRIVFALSLLVSVATFAQDANTITGKITALEDGSALPGVNVFIKGTVNGTITDIDGNYSIDCAAGDVLIFSFVGYTPEEVTIESQKVLDLALSPDIASLSEVVVIGYGTQKKSHLTGSIAKVKNEQLDQVPVSRADEALVGKMAGVQVINGDAGAGAAPTIKIRGAASLTTTSNPLLVVDGVQIDGAYLGSINMNDVESIEVLKDAASAAIYGSQAADGVIMITTKTGKAGKTAFTFNSYYGVKSPVFTHTNRPTADEWLGGDYMQKAYIDSLGTSTDWFNEMIPGGTIQSYSLSASGGTDKVTYSFSGGYLNDEGILLTDGYKKFNARANVTVKPNKYWELGISIAPSTTTQREFATDMNKALRQMPWLPIYHTEQSLQYAYNAPDGTVVGDYAREDHYKNWPDGTAEDGSNLQLRMTGDANAMQYVKERNYTTQKLDLLSSAYLKVNLYKGLSLKTQLSTVFTDGEEKNRIGVLGDKKYSNAETEMIYSRDFDWLSETFLTYDKTINEHEINAILGVSAQKQNRNEGTFRFANYPSDYITTISNSNTKSNAETSEMAITRNAIFGRLNYALSGKYLASASIRRDGSSTFGSSARYGVFPAFSAGWRIAEEGFMQNVSAVSEFKLRASWGKNGKDSGFNNPYGHLDLYAPISNVYGGSTTEPGYVTSQVGNPKLKWQESSETTIGFDFGLMSNKIFLSAEYYKKNTVDMLIAREVSAISGQNNVDVNQGAIENDGIDIELRTHNISTQDFSWTTSLILSTYNTKMTDLAGSDSLIFTVEGKRGAQHIAIVGGEPSAFYGVQEAGPLASQYHQYSTYPIGSNALESYGVDQNGDGKITDADKVVLGDPNVNFTWSFGNTFKLYNFDLAFTFIGSHGASVINVDMDYYDIGWLGKTRTDVEVPNSDLLTLRTQTSYSVQDVSYIALRDLNFGYTLPNEKTQKVGIDKLRLYVSATNLGFWMLKDEYTGYNPDGQTDTNENIANPLTQGYQNGARPIAKAITFGVNVNF